jgi:hypothetical protein
VHLHYVAACCERRVSFGALDARSRVILDSAADAARSHRLLGAREHVRKRCEAARKYGRHNNFAPLCVR